MLIAEEILVISLDDSSGERAVSRGQLLPVLAGAIIVELSLLSRITLTPDADGLVRRRRVVLQDASLTGDGLLDQTLIMIAEKPDQKLNALIHTMSTGRTGAHLYRQLVDRLVAAGVITSPDGGTRSRSTPAPVERTVRSHLLETDRAKPR